MKIRTLLLIGAVLGSGCASSKGHRAAPEGAGKADVSAEKSAAARQSSALAPTVVASDSPTVVSERRYRDPLIYMNKGFFWFNDVAYRYVLIPLSKGYTWLPEPPRRGINNFFHNLKIPVFVANDILQLKPKALGRHLARFVINSTLGIGGLFDPAKNWFKLEKKKTGFEETLARYGAGYGIYLVLPILGSSDLRNGIGRVADYFLNPVPYLTDEPVTSGINTFDGFQEIAPSAENYKKLRREVKDPYTFFRNLYLQGVQRDAEHQ